ncbi:right-handed parallel beta-helix repeat-containing protein [Acuticoccus mangrovi]|uniref:Right-handed parallel beta-helix repeat-containing protein n=1 Tax=Acuticoccus mangrovi TaxID=2796142 RepID=A0A934ITD3_9HYPH|nr:right-handed parallel beta-helix repeat-containing protein [Acuticoccus mangrovi]MBJ3778385.1 right-handed parallel beta-helix repeat-containing protein [Acuticoccus mangrovi]
MGGICFRSTVAAAAMGCALALPPAGAAQAARFQVDHTASGTVIDCKANPRYRNGFDGIDVFSTADPDHEGDWLRPSDVTIRNCEIRGSVQIWGMESRRSKAGEERMQEASRKPDFTIAMRRIAPTDIRFENCRFKLTRATGIYVDTGASFISVEGSTFVYDADRLPKQSPTTVIYLNHETTSNRIVNNVFRIRNFRKNGEAARRREIIAIDGSSDNVISGNYFLGIELGGIYLYRNCGERGIVRHSLPTNNKIYDNVFIQPADGKGAAIVFGSRRIRDYCDDDSTSMFGSGKFNQSYVINNYAFDNVICGAGAKQSGDALAETRYGGFKRRTFDNVSEPNTWSAGDGAKCRLPR